MTADDLKCDFCSNLNPTWQYPCKSFIAAPGGISAGDWTACDICHEYIESKEWSLLAARSARTSPLVKSGLISMPQANEEILKMHLRFRQSRLGPPVKIA